METSNNLKLLFRQASEHKFDDFDKSLDEASSCFAPDELGEALLMRAQIKLMSTDETFMDDLRHAKSPDTPLLFPCLNDVWTCDSPNRFVVFSDADGALRNFSELLPSAEKELGALYGESGAIMVRQMQSEILYFSGKFGEALRLAELATDRGQENGSDIMLSLYVRFRCNLAMGHRERAEQCMMDMIRTAKARPECLEAYLVVRGWANVTTGWSGDSPRFHDTPQGGSRAVLEDRLSAIRNGISRLSPKEQPFVEYASRRYGGACTMRQHYTDIFNAIYWFQAGDTEQSEEHFMKAYRASVASGLVMPFAEYGTQIIPLLRYAESIDTACSREWIASILSYAERYEECLRAYRDG